MRIVWAGVLFVVICLNTDLCAGGKTPEEVFAAMHDAYRKSGVKGFLPFVSRDSQKSLTGGMMSTFLGFRTYVHSLKDKNPDAVKLLDDLMKRQGLDETKLKPFLEKKTGPRSAEEAIANLFALAELVKDGPAFIEDVVATLNRIEGPFPPIELVPFGATAKDVKASGETAKGTMHYRFNREDRTEPVFFLREAGAWKIDLVSGVRAAFKK